MKTRPSRLLRKLRTGDVPITLKLNLSEPRVVEIAGLCGADAVWLCTEHVPNDWIGLENQIRAARVHDIDTIIERSGLPSHTVSSTLFALELKKLVRQRPGSHFVKIS